MSHDLAIDNIELELIRVALYEYRIGVESIVEQLNVAGNYSDGIRQNVALCRALEARLDTMRNTATTEDNHGL